MALTDGLISWWTLDETSAGTRADSEGTNDLTDNGVTSVTGKVNTGDQHNTGNLETSSLDLSGTSFTIASWVKSTAESGTLMVVGMKGSKNENEISLRLEGKAFGLNVVLAGDLDGDGFSSKLASAGPIDHGTWVLVVATYDASTGDTEIFIDNASQTTATNATGGGAGGSDVYRLVDGSDLAQDEVAVWNRVLSSTELNTLWNGGTGVAYSDISGGGALVFTQDATATARATGTDGTLSFQQALQVSQDGVASASAQGQDATTTEQSPLQLLQSAPASAQGSAKDATIALVTLLQFEQDGVATAQSTAQDADAALQVPITLTQGDSATATGQSVDATLTVTPNLVFGQDDTAIAQGTAQNATLTFQTALGFVQDGTAKVEARGVDATLARQAALAFVQGAPASVQARAKDALFELLAAGDVVVTTPGGETLRATSVAGQPVHDTSVDGEVS